MTDFEKLTDKVEGLIADVALNHIHVTERLEKIQRDLLYFQVFIWTLLAVLLIVVLVKP